MSKINATYHKLLNKILQEGYTYEDPNRKGINRIEIPSYKFRHEFKDGFPAISTKRIPFKAITAELIQFLSGSTDITKMRENGCIFWDKDIAPFDPRGKKCIGMNYPHQWRNFGGVPDTKPVDKTPFTNYYEYPGGDPPEDMVVTTKSHGSFLIEYQFKEGSHNYYSILFLKTGTHGKVRTSRVNLDIYDCYAPTVLSVGCLGDLTEIKKSEFYKSLFTIWHGMMSRCYNEKNDNYSYYGGRGVRVSNRWKCFEYFYNDVMFIENWEDKVKNWNDYNLDKDIIGDGFTYSQETCKWATKFENTQQSKAKYQYVIRNSLTNEVYSFVNQSLAIRQLNIKHQGNFAAMLRNERTQSEHWSIVSKKKLVNNVDQIQELIDNMINKPMSSELIVSAWNPSDKKEMSLPPCHYGFQIVMKPLNQDEMESYSGKSEIELDALYEKCNQDENLYLEGLSKESFKYGFELHWNQRSCDLFLGIPANIASYALLALILEKITGHKALAIQGDLKKVHLYDNSLDAVKEQLSRDVNKYGECDLLFKDEFHYIRDKELVGNVSLNKIISEMKPDWFVLENYESYPALSVEMLERDE